MTYREKLQQEHPDFVDPRCAGGCAGCPETYGYEEPRYDCSKFRGLGNLDQLCAACWDREIPEDKNGK